MKRLARIMWESTVIVVLIGNLAAIAAVAYSRYPEARAVPAAPAYDMTLTRVCPNAHCRYAVIDDPITRCPACWTLLPVDGPFRSAPPLPPDFMTPEWAARHGR